MIGNANGINLNSDSLYRISKVGGIGLVLATRIVQNRPFRRWSDLEKIDGFDEETVNDLRGSGAILGDPTTSTRTKTSTLPSRVVRTRKTKRTDVGAHGKPTKTPPRRRVRNIFSGEGETPE